MPRDPDWFINSEPKLARFLDAIADEGCLAIDTEANPMHAYRERVCLIQVSTGEEDFVLDPLAGLDLTPFFRVLAAPKVTKIFHDVEYDLIQLTRDFDVRIRGLCDTKVLAVALGEPAVGLASLLEKYLEVELDKRYQRSDWGRRPLREEQLDYARRDTRFLFALSEILEARLDDLPELVQKEIDSEIHRLEHLEIPPRPPLDPAGYLKLKGARSLDPDAQARLEQLYLWREKRAEALDRPPYKVLGNAQLYELAAAGPTTRSSLSRVHGMPATLVERFHKDLLTAIEGAGDAPVHTTLAPKGDPDVPRMTEAQRLAYDRLKAWRKDRAAERPTDPSHILNREVMARLARFEPVPGNLRELARTKLIERWRCEAYGSELLDALHQAPRSSRAKGSRSKRGRKSSPGRRR